MFIACFDVAILLVVTCKLLQNAATNSHFCVDCIEQISFYLQALGRSRLQSH
jgi:hypothetical protein